MKAIINAQIKKEEIVFRIAEEAKYEEVVKILKKKMPQIQKKYGKENLPIRISGKALKNKEIDEIKAIIQEKMDVEVEFDIPKGLGLSSIKKTFEQDTIVSETTFHRGSLRSGQTLEIEGSVIILGDINSGAEVMASGNIVVLGTLRGLAHAGAGGNKQAIVAAGLLDTVQIRIANIVKEIDRDEAIPHKQCYVYVVNDAIQIE